MRTIILLLIAATASAMLGCNVRSEVAEKTKPSFTLEEADAWVGARVRSVREYDPSRSKLLTELGSALYSKTGSGLEYANPAGMKCPEAGRGGCLNVSKGELGTVTGMSRVRDGGYFLVVRWDTASQDAPMLSYFGRKTCRLFLEKLGPHT